MFALVRSLTVPTLGVCGGHQAMVLAYGGAIGPVDGGVARGDYSEHRKYTGEQTIHLSDELFNGAGRFVVSHVEGATTVPSGLRVIGTSDYCAVQAVRVVGEPKWGVQFHPELGGDGLALLSAFLKLAGAHPAGV